MPDQAPFPAGAITVALGGTRLLSSFVQEADFYTAQNVAVLIPKNALSFTQKLYICAAIRHNRFKYSAFGREANRTIKTLSIPSPSDFPEWINDAVSIPQAPMREALDSLDAMLPAALCDWTGDAEVVTLSDLFVVRYGSNHELINLQRDENGVNFVSRTEKNNGVSARVKRLANNDPLPGGVLTVAGGGSVLATFLQTEPFYSGRDMYVLTPRYKLTTEQLLFYCFCIRANRFRFSYGRQANRTLKDLQVPSPNNLPSWIAGALPRIAKEVRIAISVDDSKTASMSAVA